MTAMISCNTLQDVKQYAIMHEQVFGGLPLAVGVTQDSYIAIWKEICVAGLPAEALDTSGQPVEVPADRIPDEIYIDDIVIVVNRFVSLDPFSVSDLPASDSIN